MRLYHSKLWVNFIKANEKLSIALIKITEIFDFFCEKRPKNEGLRIESISVLNDPHNKKQ